MAKQPGSGPETPPTAGKLTLSSFGVSWISVLMPQNVCGPYEHSSFHFIMSFLGVLMLHGVLTVVVTRLRSL